MQPIQIEEIKDLATYERVRAETRKTVIELRKLRRIQLGDRISVVFENRETVLYQIQEILREVKVREGKLDLSRLRALSDDEVEAYLTSLPGVAAPLGVLPPPAAPEAMGNTLAPAPPGAEGSPHGTQPLPAEVGSPG